MLTKSELPKDLLQNSKKEYVGKQLDYWTYKVPTRVPYNCHLFTLVCLESKELDECWEDLTENIAVNFQINLNSEVERWNIYLLLLFEKEVSKEIKYKIEQDKYCCRKLVEDNLKTSDFSEKYVSRLIEEKIFSLHMETSKIDVPTTLVEKTIEAIIEESNHNILQALAEFKNNNQIGPFYKKFKENTDEQK
jgi:hypothetical protein